MTETYDEYITSEQGKVEGIVLNTVLNSFHDEKYNHWDEAMLWAKSKDYFPNLSDEELFIILRKYEVWNEFEALCERDGCKLCSTGYLAN
jgi:hypothetical protein